MDSAEAEGATARVRRRSKRAPGGGAGLAAEPMGIVEISAAGTRYLAFPKYRNTGIALALGVALGFLAGARAARRNR